MGILILRLHLQLRVFWRLVSLIFWRFSFSPSEFVRMAKIKYCLIWNEWCLNTVCYLGGLSSLITIIIVIIMVLETSVLSWRPIICTRSSPNSSWRGKNSFTFSAKVQPVSPKPHLAISKVFSHTLDLKCHLQIHLYFYFYLPLYTIARMFVSIYMQEQEK